MPRLIAVSKASTALPSSRYIRNRLPDPNPRIVTSIPVRPKTRVGSFSLLLAPSAGATANPSATVSRNCLRFIVSAPRLAQALAELNQNHLARFTRVRLEIGAVRLESLAPSLQYARRPLRHS